MKITLINSKHTNITGISQYSNYLQKYLSYVINYFVQNSHLALVNNPIFINPPKSDIFHFTHQQQSIPLLYLKGKKIITVHDIYPYISKQYSSNFEKVIYPIEILALRKATHIIADSEFTKQELIKYARIPEKQITVIHLGVDSEIFKPTKTKPEPYTILNVCNEVPRKNSITLIKAFALLKKELYQAKLVKVGAEHAIGLRSQLQNLAKNLGVSDSIIWKEYIPDIIKEYNKASLFVFPSLYEGFGLPILESMASGVPVICSDKTSLPEVAGDAALYFNGTDEKKLAESMYEVLTNIELNKKLRKKGFRRTKKMTWKKTAKETQEVYETVWNK